MQSPLPPLPFATPPRYLPYGLQLVEFDPCTKLGWYSRRTDPDRTYVFDLRPLFEASTSSDRWREYFELEEEAAQQLGEDSIRDLATGRLRSGAQRAFSE